ncbi:MAG: hypothetical protein WCJ13_10625 [Coriobacteriia bacterium]
MTDSSHFAENPATATALAEPPAPPGAPPVTAAGVSPAPKRRRWIGWVIGIVIAVIVIGSLVGLVVWARGRGASSSDFSIYRPGFESAMLKTKTTATFPGAPVELGGVSATGSHSFQATFTAEEITALVNVFRWTTDIQGTSVAVSGAQIGFPSAGNASLSATVKLNNSAYSGTLEGPVAYTGGTLTSPGATKVLAEGIPIGGDRATQATNMLLVYLNAYLAAAPGLTVDSADITASGVTVKGTAPDSLALP